MDDHKTRLEITLKYSGVPQTPSDFQSTYQTCVSVTLQWQPGFSGGPAQTFTITYTDLNTSQEYTERDIEDSDDPEGSITVKVTDGISPSHRYRFYIMATNRFGNSTVMSSKVYTTPGGFISQTSWD